MIMEINDKDGRDGPRRRQMIGRDQMIGANHRARAESNCR